MRAWQVGLLLGMSGAILRALVMPEVLATYDSAEFLSHVIYVGIGTAVFFWTTQFVAKQLQRRFKRPSSERT